MDDTFDIRMAALKRKIQQQRFANTTAIENVESISLLQTIALQNLQMQNAIANLQPVQVNEFSIHSYRRPRRYEGYSVRQNNAETQCKTGRGEIRKKRTEQKFNARRKWRILSSVVFFGMKISKKYRQKLRDEEQAKLLIEDGTGSLARLYAKSEAFSSFIETIKTLSTEGCDVLVRDGLGFLFTKKPNKSQTSRFSNAIKGLFELVLSTTIEMLPPKTIELLKRITSTAGPMLQEFYWPNEQIATLPTSLVYLIIVKCLCMRSIMDYTGSELELKAQRAAVYILYRIVRQANEGKQLMEMEDIFFKKLQTQSNSKEEVENWSDNNLKLVYRLCESWMPKAADQLLSWALSFADCLSNPKPADPTPVTESPERTATDHIPLVSQVPRLSASRTVLSNDNTSNTTTKQSSLQNNSTSNSDLKRDQVPQAPRLSGSRALLSNENRIPPAATLSPNQSYVPSSLSDSKRGTKSTILSTENRSSITNQARIGSKILFAPHERALPNDIASTTKLVEKEQFKNSLSSVNPLGLPTNSIEGNK